MTFKHLLLLSSFVLASCSDKIDNKQNPKERPPNIVYILADDLGYGDLSIYGQELFATPNIDQLANEGMLFTQHYSGSTVCAPSRSSLMTGQHTGHTFIRGNKEVRPEGQHPLPAVSYTLAEALKDNGYVNGAFGKWGLGFPGSSGDPMKQGFDRFYGYNCQRYGHHYYPRHLWSDEEKVFLPENNGKLKGIYAPELIQDETLKFIEENKDTSFFLFVPSIIPHAELIAPESYMEKTRGKYLPELNYEGYDEGEDYRNGPYESQEESHAAFVAMIMLLDDQVGEIVNKLDELGIRDNTIIMFTSDNGPHREGGADPDYFNSNGPLKGYKRDLYEGGIRVPMIANWPGKIKAATSTNHISAFWDIFPTVADLVGFKIPSTTDGISFLPTLIGEEQTKQHEYLYWEFHERGGRTAIRQGDWKAVKYNVLKDPDAKLELYNLSEDIGEENNIADEHPTIVDELNALFKSSRVPSEIFAFGDGTYLNN